VSEAERLRGLRDAAVRKLAWHRAMMREHAAWLDEVAGRRAQAEGIARDLQRFIRETGRQPGASRAAR
jgi:hypothetical protein